MVRFVRSVLSVVRFVRVPFHLPKPWSDQCLISPISTTASDQTATEEFLKLSSQGLHYKIDAVNISNIFAVFSSIGTWFHRNIISYLRDSVCIFTSAGKLILSLPWAETAHMRP